jgi:hypothetical protein
MRPKKKKSNDSEQIVAMSLRLSQSLSKKIRDLAKEEQRSINGQVVHMLNSCFKEYSLHS